MTKSCRFRTLATFASALVLSNSAFAHDETEVAQLLAEAETALNDGDFGAGVAGYLATARASDSAETARQATLTAFHFGYDQIASEAAARWLEVEPESLEAEQYRAYASLRAGDVDAATKQMVTVINQADDDEAACEHAADALGRDVRAADVGALFATLAKQLDETPCILRLAASTALANNESDTAEKHLKRLRKIDAFGNDARLIEMSRLVRDEQSEAAFTDDSLRLDDTATTEQRIQLAFLNARAEDTDNAMNMISQLRLEEPDNAEVMLAEGLLQLQGGDADASRRTFLSLLATGEKTPDALFYLARFAERDRRFDQARRMYSQVEYGDLVLAAQQRVSQMIGEREGIEAGIAHIDAFVKRHPRYGLQLSTVQAAAYAEGEYFDQALELYDEYLEVRPNAEFAMLGRADVLLQADREDAAIRAFRDVVKRFPDSAGALNALGYTLADRTRKFREAEKLIDRALEKEPDNAAIIDSKGWVLFRRGRFEEALEYLEQAWEKFPDPEVAAHLGETLWRLGREDQSRELLQQAWQRFPNNDHLRETIQRLLEDGPTTRS